ncbi:MAG: efflux RND transporter permease subunit [Bacillota bacterium]
MGLAALAIRRPVATVMLVLMALFLGTVALLYMPSDLLPEIKFPAIAVITEYGGAGPHEVENLVTRRVEEALGTTADVRHISSESSEGLSLVIAEFNWGVDMDMAALEVRESVDYIGDYLPSDAGAPIVIKTDPSLLPIMQISLSGPYDLIELTYMADLVEARLERIGGVASVSVSGGVVEEIAVEADPVRLNSHGLTLHQVCTALSRENLSLPGGYLSEAGQRLTLRTVGEFVTLDDVRSVHILTPRGAAVSLGDIARVSIVEQQTESRTRLNAEPAVTMSVQEQSGANTVQVARNIHRALVELRDELPADVDITVVGDQSDFINRSIATVSENVLFGGMLAIAILYLFLADFRTVLVIGLAIPISVVSTFAFMYFSGLTLNLVSLGGLALGVGMLVDNAIVILENIFRHRETGASPEEAAVRGTGEVAGAVTASTLTTVAVFLPVVFIEGLAAQIFRQLAMTISFSLASSLLVSLTFVPMAAGIFLRRDARRSGGLAARSAALQDRLRDRYGDLVRSGLRRRFLIAGSALVLFAGAVAVALSMPRLFLPAMDQRQVDIEVSLPRGAVLDRTDRVMRQIEAIVLDRDDVEFAFVSAGRQTGTAGFRGGSADVGGGLVQLVPRGRDVPSTYEVMADLRREFQGIAGAEILVSLSSSIAGEDQLMQAPVAVSVLGDDLDTVVSLAEQIRQLVKEVPGTVNVRSTWEEGAPEVQLRVNRQLASQFGLTVADVAMTIRAAVEGEVATRYRLGERDIDVRVMLSELHRGDLTSVQQMTLLTPTGAQVSVGQLAETDRESGPTTIFRQDQARTVEVQADLDGRGLSSVMDDIRAGVEDLSLPSGYAVQYGGETQEMMEAFEVLGGAFLIGCILMYMVLAAQFESFLQPLIVMVTIPLAMIGVVAALQVWGLALSVPAIVGVIGMAGIVVNNSIVMITYMNQLRADGKSAAEAIVRGAVVRLRPVLMTSTTTILGLLPMALESGDGAEMQNAMAASVLGGLLVSTALTLFVVPAVYSFFTGGETGNEQA